MTEYQLKHRTVEAQRFDLDRVDELTKWAKGHKVASSSDGWWIVLGPKTAVPGDYIIRMEDGSHYPMSAEQFEDQYEVVGGTEDRDYVLARLLAKAEVVVPEIHLPESAFAEGYHVELGEHRFTQAQWEAIQLYASGVAQLAEAEARDEFIAGHKAQRQVRAFHEGMGQPVGTSPRALPDDRVAVRIELIREEFVDELIPALGASMITPDKVQVGVGPQDVVEVADAAIDILYVVYGLLVEMGIDAEPLFDEVQASNMSKFGADGKAIIAGENDPDGVFPGRVKKGPNYFKPDLARVLNELALKADQDADPLAHYRGI
ncbi:MazG-like nucleotide pyrophosphohydrolase [Microbacterium phage Neferthena]|uniref:MazG-like nucleotide pyrophosphohydrolase n=1 Tax=Microbacterium phage Neferthena TaxID=2301539 RepID=A0A385D5B0_9CAUD|nr:nucleotide pyrophosphohydrolase [Microbacterium phage Neferthena]AXQ52907.1 MazG-like nucleotide pyrophosphohydrolase [Microbacterium phage Neferthena]